MDDIIFVFNRDSLAEYPGDMAIITLESILQLEGSALLYCSVIFSDDSLFVFWMQSFRPSPIKRFFIG